MSQKNGMRKVAEIANVSIATVSRTLNSPERVSKETREKVLRAIEDNQYIYNSSAADLSRNMSQVIGVIIPDAQMPMFGSALVAIQDYLQNQEKNYSTMVASTNYDKNMEAKLLKQFRQRNVAGIIRTGYDRPQSEMEEYLLDWGVPSVVILEKLARPDLSYVGFDNYKAAHSAVEYLVSLGHRKIGLVIGPFERQRRVRQRFDGYKAVLEENNIQFDPDMVIETKVGLLEGKNAMSKLMTLSDPPTAVFAASDRLAIGGLRCATERGISVPKDVSIIGYGDIESAAFCNPPLTTIGTPTYACARKATEVIIEQIENRTNNVSHHCLNAELIIRESCMQNKHLSSSI